MGKQPLLRGRQSVQQERQGDRRGELRAGRQRVRPVPEERAAAVTGEHERGAVAASGAGVTGPVRVTEVDGAVTAAVAAPLVGHCVYRQ